MMVLAYLGLTLAALVLAASVSPARGWRLLLALFVLGWVLGQFNNLIEGIVFGVIGAADATVAVMVLLPAYAVAALLAVTILWRWTGASGPTVRPDASPAKLAVIVIGYELLYWGAGTLVWPYVAGFYTKLPPVWLVAALQVPRALIFVAAAWPWLRTGPRMAPLVLAVAFSVIGGIAPLLPENPFMPEHIRVAHGFEVGISNFLFGLLVGWLLKPKP
jgi:hypothetical protein